MKKIFIVLITIVFIASCYYLRLMSQINVYYVKTPTEELICWGKNICGWTWTRTGNYDPKLIIQAGILQKNYPENIISKKLLTTIYHAKNEYSPVTNFQITSNHVFFDIDNDGKYYLYDFNKTSSEIVPLKVGSSDPHTISSIRSDEQLLLLSTFNKKTNRQEFFTYDLKKARILSPSYFVDSFEWKEGNKVNLGVVNRCNPNDVKHYLCPVFTDLFNCPEFPKLSSNLIASMSDPLQLFDSLHLDIPAGWIFNPSVNYLQKDTAIIQWSTSCSSSSTPFSGYNRTKIINKETVKIKIYSKPEPSIELDSSILAQARFEVDSKYYSFDLLSRSDSTQINKDLTTDFLKMLDSIKFIKNYFEYPIK